MNFAVACDFLCGLPKPKSAASSRSGVSCKHVRLSLLVTAVVLLCAASIIPNASCSAIPMWEFLSRTEKMSHLFNTFAKQAAEYCKSSSMPDCNKVILIHGLTNLAKMDDVSLDQMDPYQRGANDKIWYSMMRDSSEVTSQSQSQSQVSEAEHERDYYTDALGPVGTDENYLGSASSNVEQSETAPGTGDDNDNDDGSSNQNDTYMTGPMVVRVRADGSPIPADQQQAHLPTDEDMEEHIAMRSKSVPSVSELQAFFSPAAAAAAAAPSKKEFLLPTRYNILRSPYYD